MTCLYGLLSSKENGEKTGLFFNSGKIECAAGMGSALCYCLCWCRLFLSEDKNKQSNTN